MAGPITWRNISSGAGSGAGGLLAAGQQQMAQGIQTLQNVIAQAQKEGAANRAQLRDYNTQQFLDSVAAADLATLATPEGQAALNAQRTGFGVNIDQAATRNAIQDRLLAGQKAAIQQGQFEDFTTERDQRGLVDQLRGLAAAGDQAQVSQILDQNEFLNEGALRGELSSVFDNAQQRQYRENAEGRAQRGEARSAASHALSMESGRENLAYNRVMHREGIRKIEEDNLADRLAMEVHSTTQNQTQAQNALVADIARSAGLDMLPDGSIDMRGTDPDTQDAVARALAESGAGNNTATAARQRIVDMARENGLGTAATQAAIQRYDAVRAFDSLAPEDQAKVQQEAQAATSELRATEKKLTDTYNRKSKDNPFLAPSNDVTADSNKIVEAASKKYDSDWFSTDINKADLGRQAIDLMQNGVSMTLDGEDLDGVIPPSIIERALLENGANTFLSEGGTVRNLVEKYIRENKGIQRQIKESQSLTEQFQADMAKINGEKIKIESSITKARQKEKGVTVSNNDWIDALIRRRSSSGN